MSIIAPRYIKLCYRRILRTLGRYRVVRSLFLELRYISKRYPTEGKDPFEWVAQSTFRKLYWDLFLRYRLPLAIEFEMNSRCNRACSYCPVSAEARPPGFFDEDNYRKLIDDLAEHNFRGQIVPNFYGEPLLDKRIYDFVHYAAQKLPHCTIIINTNADALKIDGLHRLLNSGVSLVLISQHDPVPSGRIQTIQNYLENNPELNSQVIITDWTTKGRKLSNRGGLVDDPRVQYMPASGCFRSRRATMTFDGSLVICCEDYNAEYVYGDISEGFVEVWKGCERQRRSIFIGKYQEPICWTCIGQG